MDGGAVGHDRCVTHPLRAGGDFLWLHWRKLRRVRFEVRKTALRATSAE
jgi:hypothetical protein